MQNQHSNYDAGHQPLCISTISQDCLRILELRTLEVIFEQKLDSESQLVRQHELQNGDVGSSADHTSSMLSQSAYMTELVVNGETMSIVLKRLYKTLPLHQFQCLMENKQFEEAEKLAEKHGMDDQVSRFCKLMDH